MPGKFVPRPKKYATARKWYKAAAPILPMAVQVVAKKRQYKRKPYKPKPKARPRPMRGQQDGGNHKHCAKANVGRPLAVPGAIGDMLCVDSLSRMTFTTKTVDTYLIVQWCNNAIRGMELGGNKWIVPVAPASQLLTGVPITVRPLRMTCSIRNTTVMTGQAGFIRVLNTPAPLEWEWNALYTDPDSTIVSDTFHEELGQIMKAHPKVTTHSAIDLTHGRKWIIPPASMTAFKDWYPYNPNNTRTEAKSMLAASAMQNPMNTLIVLFPGAASEQTYDVSLFDQTATRFSVNTLYGHLSTPPPTGVTEAAFQRGVQWAQHHASQGLHDSNMGNTPPQGGGGTG
jgi:hypothetical protein